MKNIIVGQYIPGKSFLYKMDPRSKILALFILMVSAFVFKDITHIIYMLLGVLVILKIGGIPIMRIARGLRPIMILLLFTFTFQVLFIKTGPVILDTVLTLTTINIGIMILAIVVWYYTRRYIKSKFFYMVLVIVGILTMLSLFTPGTVISSSNLTIYEDGLLGASFIMVRLIIIVTLSTILTLTTKPTDLNLGLERILKPLNLVKINSEEIALIISIALRYIPTLLDEANKIMLAQASRGVDFTEGKFKDKVMQIISLLVPMFIISFKRSDDLANAMEARSFVPGNKRTRIHILSWQSRDTLVIVFCLLVLTATVVVRVYL
ncbi:MAG: energy-coupling factor transporter transmembrane protein EcfT [Candidatus Izimaplasma sp.]|nr:energy-coupling factor transporter transmembrane protein EcfT [Candidatus Izimaplasma bacterium]